MVLLSTRLSSGSASVPGLCLAAWGAAEALVPTPASFLSLTSGWTPLVHHPWGETLGAAGPSKGDPTHSGANWNSPLPAHWV